MKTKLLLSLAVLLLCVSWSVAQSPQAAPAQSPAVQQSPSPVPSPSASPVTPNNRVEIEEEPVEKDHKLTPAEAHELLLSVDEVLHFVSRDTLLPIKHDVKKRIVSRNQVEKFITERFKDDVDRIRFERSELVLKKFGLLPRTFDLHSFLIKLLTEQVAGYYDEKTKTMNLLDWIAPDMQKAVMAHELTHALQDQSYDLEKMSRHEEAIEKKGLDDLKGLIEEDEQSTCRSAVMEGQGMIVLVDYMLQPVGKSVQSAPQIVEMMQSSMEKDKNSPVFESAPELLQDELIFPYRQGMNFIKELLLVGGKKLAYTGVLDRMPQTTREILEPKEYLAGHRVPPLYLPDVSFLKKDYEPYDAGAVGEFDVNVILKIYDAEKVANYLSPEWRGGAYYAAGRKGVTPADKNSTGHIGLYYISKWSGSAPAQEFARIYASSLPQRYKQLQHQPADPAQPGLDRYTSSDGPIYIQQKGNMVIAVESFEPDNAQKLIAAGLKQGDSAREPQPVAGSH
ncbi:MAG TPA: hypothetical protein VJN64_03180 [Terriglobales bacterium]|nr:hypothetical protein [Terriglobales bacterium]